MEARCFHIAHRQSDGGPCGLDRNSLSAWVAEHYLNIKSIFKSRYSSVIGDHPFGEIFERSCPDQRLFFLENRIDSFPYLLNHIDT
jgi:hypothetical protein